MNEQFWKCECNNVNPAFKDVCSCGLVKDDRSTIPTDQEIRKRFGQNISIMTEYIDEKQQMVLISLVEDLLKTHFGVFRLKWTGTLQQVKAVELLPVADIKLLKKKLDIYAKSQDWEVEEDSGG